MVRDLVVGADIGGTATRVGVADLAGSVLALATGGPGNPISVGVAGSAAEIRAVTASALTGISGTVRAVVIGLAGGSRAAADPSFGRAAVPNGVEVAPQLVSDLSVAFGAATPLRSGYVVVAGTGAVAGHVRDNVLVEHRDGWGWLLGDEGSGFWIGREAVRATLTGLQGQTALGPLQQAVLAAAGAGGYLELLAACYSATPTWLARFSPLVSEHAHQDPVAAGIATAAVDQLENLWASLSPLPGEPVVLAGSVLTAPGPVGRELRSRLAGHGASVLYGPGGVAGALWLALQPWVGDDPLVHRHTLVHRRLVSTTRRRIAGPSAG